ncbi:hypothetical protein [Flectobacillus major]|jgi:DNA-directed RNA polymerase specialized sigma54-like protein|uniref:hypothetical protein n=1 Tax=Flectobacillus major TaxID=103 RepID=UPI00041D65F4|nr:hypothetical protein [Flectobacillus major]
MTTPTQLKPMTRQQVAASLGISTKTLTRFIKTQGIAITPRSLLKPKLASLIIQKYHGD